MPPRIATKGAAALLLLAGCATSSIEARWIDRQIGPRSLAWATILAILAKNLLDAARSVGYFSS